VTGVQTCTLPICTSDLTCVEIITPCNIDIKLTLKSYSNGIVLTWLPRLENVTYKVYRNEEFMEEVTENTFKDFINFDKRYCYSVIAKCPADLESEPSNEKCVGNVSIDELENGIRIYPNPTTGEFLITNYELEIRNIEIYDVFGKKRQFSIINSQLSIEHLPTGVYFLHIKTETETFIRKVVKSN
jgi:hypothetical protein